ncbi:extracellular solute-binding protein [Sulfobacillus harzensis]|uniref:Solute-binding protein n=1 Tax=Sulfobacillus harzensis TaxID=2729629 RepID=A0A7Y0Q291_9FIRM|nr:extracellular solute-binding protein [Sulfobacillus harzensis]NMP21676.1 solute-binding protein [Sulfobacillus harzensis]
MRRIRWVVVGFLGTALLAGCGEKTPTAKPQGTVTVAYAGSLEDVNDQIIGPQFEKATGYAYQGEGGGALGMAQKIRSHTIAANVFESMGYAPIQLLEPHQARWAVSFASSPLVIAFNPKSRYGTELTAIKEGKKPLSDLFTLMQSPGFRLGRTNPNTDPQGQAFYMMVELAEKKYHLPAGTASKILGVPDNPHQVYSEEGILTLLQSGALDASSAFLSEAEQRHLDFIRLPQDLNFADPSQNAWYSQASVRVSSGVVHGSALTIDITTVGQPSPGALSFVRYVLGPKGQHWMKSAGYTVLPPQVVGARQALPKTLRSLVR